MAGEILPDELIIGIDLGTTNSVVAVVEHDEPKIIENGEGKAKTPSVVAFTDDDKTIVGEAAARQMATNPERSIGAVKRFIGLPFSEIQIYAEKYPYKIVADDDEQILIQIEDVAYTPQQISSLVLTKLKEAAEEKLQCEINKAIVTVPAYFDDRQRQATVEAGEMAGLEVLRLVNEPTAAAMAYGLSRKADGIVVVYDFGGGTFDISILEIINKSFEVLTTHGDTFLGGEDFDMLIVDHMITKIEAEHGVDVRKEPMAFRRLKEAAEQAKIELSSSSQATISLPFFIQKDDAPIHLEQEITRDDFEDLIEPMVKQSLECCKEAMASAGLKKREIDRVILVGGSTRIPLVQEMVEDYFGIEPFKGVNPDEIVALGAAAQGGVLAGGLEEVVLLEITPHSLGIEIRDNRCSSIIPKNSTIPIKASKTFTTTEDFQEFVNIHVLQGEDSYAPNNRSLGKYVLADIKSMKAGAPRIEVIFSINADGIVEVIAKDIFSENGEALTVRHSFLSGDEREDMRAKRSKKRSKKRKRRSKSDTSPIPRRMSAITDDGESIVENETQDNSDSDVQPRPLEELKPVGDELIAVGPDLSSRKPEALPEDESLSDVNSAATVSNELPPNQNSKGEEPASATISNLTQDVNQPSESVKSTECDEEETLEESSASVALDALPDEESIAAEDASADVAEETGEKTGVSEERNSFLIEIVPDAGAEILEAEKIVMRQDHTEEEREVVAACAPKFDEIYAEHDEHFPMHEVMMLVKCCLRESQAALEQVELTTEKFPDHQHEILYFYNRLLDAFPNYPAALKKRAVLHEALGHDLKAIMDYEQVMLQETGDTAVLESLQLLYMKMMKQEPDASLQFKLVKLHLKKSEIDEAISILQQLASDTKYLHKATKILGFCFWQKHMYYLAWQKFKSLVVNDEIKDILYRLSIDMETADQLTNAKYALERILEHDINFRDVQERMSNLNERIKRQQESIQSPRANEPGRVLRDGRFIILEEVNRGSMGIIYRAKDKVLDEIVALKVLNEYLCSDPQAVERFKREARAAKRLSHPSIVRIHDLYENDNKLFLSMEYIEGSDLKILLQEATRFAWEEMQEMVMQICDALRYAHKLNIVHRDIKPANIMVTKGGDIKVTDFGIAKLMFAKDATSSSSMIMGTPLYMSPEQIEGTTVDARTDIYAFGVMLWEKLAGAPPYNEGNIEYQHCHAEIPKLPDDVPEGVAQIVYKCMAKLPADRFLSVSELQKAFQSL